MRLRYGIFLLGAVALAQDTGNRVTFQFADPSRPGVLQGSLMNGCFAVEGYEGRDVEFFQPVTLLVMSGMKPKIETSRG